MTADNRMYLESSMSASDVRPAGPENLLLMPASATGTQADRPPGLMAEVVRTAIARTSPAEALRAVIDMAVESGPCDAASITTLGSRRSVTTVAHSDDRVLEADRLQYELSEGPCLDAVWTNGVYLVPDLLADGRWPRWAPEAARLGIAALMSVHLFANTRLGSLNLYSLTRRQFEDTEVETARVVAAHASVVLAYASTTAHLWRAVDARNLIGQAQGMLMARYGLTAPKAFAVLLRYSQHHNIKLNLIAEQLTTTGQLPDLDVRQLIDTP